jgi:NAD(P)-dependent dehydrogenase (short-subunit alcohol dehydrogenase family)
MKILENKIALITGAGSGIGRAIALLYAREGARIVVTDMDEKGGNETTRQVKADGGEAIFLKADTSSPADNKKMVDLAISQYGALHIAVNNAGIAGPISFTGEYPIEGWDKVIAVNLSGVFYGLHFQIPAIIKSGGGSIVNVASILGKVAAKGSPAYVAAKHGVVGLTETAALEYANQNVRINSIGPGYIITPMLTNIMDEATMKGLENLHPMGRLGRSEEVAELALWLNSDKSSFVTGSYYNVDGGYLAQ